MIEKNTLVKVSYELRTAKEGDVLEMATPETPLEFISGNNQTLKDFESNLLNLSKGDKFDFSIKSEDAYGEANEDMIVELEKSIFSSVESKDMVVGNELPMVDSTGRHLSGRILAIDDENVKLDFNHPLAGNDLYFSGMIIDEREATEEELNAIHHDCASCQGCNHEEGSSCSGEGSCGEGGCSC